MTELQKVVYEVLQQSAVPMQNKDIYAATKLRAPHLCDDTIVPCTHCGQKHPRWIHDVQWALQNLKTTKLAHNVSRGYWESVRGIGTPIPSGSSPTLSPAEPWTNVSIHERIKLQLKEIGEILGRHCKLEFREPPYIYDVVWSDNQGLPPSHVFEVQDKGQVDGALSKLQHALAKFPCQERLFIVVTGERDRRKIEDLLHPFLTGTFHQISRHTTVLTPEEVDDIHQYMLSHKQVLKRLVGQ